MVQRQWSDKLLERHYRKREGQNKARRTCRVEERVKSPQAFDAKRISFGGGTSARRSDAMVPSRSGRMRYSARRNSRIGAVGRSISRSWFESDTYSRLRDCTRTDFGMRGTAPRRNLHRVPRPSCASARQPIFRK
jgi:hypothetical protein